MKNTTADSRLLPSLNSEYEWKYLINETLVGERCIIPLLNDLRTSPYMTPELVSTLNRQIEEEEKHVRQYEAFVGSDKLQGSRYDIAFSKLVGEIPSTTLKLFALQGMLEGIALGALYYRLHNWKDCPSYSVDRESLREEAAHVGLSFAHFRTLISHEGFHDRAAFRSVARKVNSVFRTFFSESSLINIAENDFGIRINSSQLGHGALNMFKKMSVEVLTSSSNRFISSYLRAQ